jgi:hypothetical protein
MVEAVVAAQPPATPEEVAEYIHEVARDHIDKLRRSIMASEEEWRSSRPDPSVHDPSVHDRITIPVECYELDDDDVELDADATNPPTSLSVFQRAVAWQPPRRSRVVSLIALVAAVVFAIAYTAGRSQEPDPEPAAAREPPSNALEAPPMAVDLPPPDPTASASAKPRMAVTRP